MQEILEHLLPLVYKSGTGSTINEFIDLSHDLKMKVFKASINVNTTKDMNELLLISTMDYYSDLPRVEYSERLIYKNIPSICGELKTWFHEEDWQNSENIRVLNRYMDTIETRIKNVLGPEISFSKKVKTEILYL